MKHVKKYENNEYETTFDWEKFKEYVNTYEPKTHGINKWNTILNDMLYGLGISLDDEFEFADGFKKFKQFLKDDVHWKTKKDANKYNL